MGGYDDGFTDEERLVNDAINVPMNMDNYIKADSKIQTFNTKNSLIDNLRVDSNMLYNAGSPSTSTAEAKPEEPKP